MAIPKFKNNIKVYPQKELSGRRGELLNDIIKSDTFLPDSILHDDLDMGMLDYVLTYFKVTSNGEQIPIIPRIISIQKWGEISNTWSYIDDDNNIKIPFISIVRKPDAQPGTNPSAIRTIPDRKNFYYHSVPTWDGNKKGFNIYKIPQPVAVDISYDITIVSNEIRELNKLNKIILQKFSSRQSYTKIKGHYIPIILESVTDSSQINNIENRRFFVQTYKLILLGLIVDENEFEIIPGINRVLLLDDILEYRKKPKLVSENNITSTLIIGDGIKKTFGVGESIEQLYHVIINGVEKFKDIDFYFINKTSRITFINTPLNGDKILIVYDTNKFFMTNYNKLLLSEYVNFTYNGSTLTFDLGNQISTVLNLNINGVTYVESINYIVNETSITLLIEPVIGSEIGITYVKYGNNIKIETAELIADGIKTIFNYNTIIKNLFFVSINGIIQERDKHYIFIDKTSLITFIEPPLNNDKILIGYSKNEYFIDTFGGNLFVDNKNFIYDGSTLTFEFSENIFSVLYLNINGIIDIESGSYTISDKSVTLLYSPSIGSSIGITYVR